MKLKNIFLYALALASLASATAAPITANPSILVPAYFYPTFDVGNPWSQLNAAASKVQVNAIVNPNNGRFNSVDTNYSAVIDNLRAAGGMVFGYVQTNYGNYREHVADQNGNVIIQGFDFAMAKHDVDQYLNFYHIDGFFIDEMSAQESKVPDYVDLYNYIKAKNSGLQVIGNAGVGGVEDSLRLHAVDILVNFEGYGSNYAATPPPAWVQNYTPSNFANLAHGVASVSDMQALVSDLANHHANNIFVTDRLYANNPWAGLPSYWDQEVSAVAALSEIPEPKTLPMIVLGLLTVILIGQEKRFSRNNEPKADFWQANSTIPYN